MTFEEEIRNGLKVDVISDGVARQVSTDEIMMMAWAARARCLRDLMRDGPLTEDVLIDRTLPPGLNHHAPIRTFMAAILTAMVEANEITRKGLTFTITDAGRKAYPEAKARGMAARPIPPDNGRGRE